MPESTTEIAVGVPMFCRERALRNLLESVPFDDVATVYVADNGESTDRALYGEMWPFDLEVLELVYDAGIGACRRAIANECTEPYLWVGDSDMQIMDYDDLWKLRAILDAHDDLGGVSGWLLEGNTVRAGARDITIHDGVAIKEALEVGQMEHDPYPHARFDMIPQAGLFRTAIYQDYNYDDAVDSSEHFDFFYEHKQLGKWEFASTPTVLTRHDRDIDPAYRESRGQDHVDVDVLEAKHGITGIEAGTHPDWGQVRDRGLKEQTFDVVKRTTPPPVWLRLKHLAERVGMA